VNATISTGAATGTILNDDPAAMISVSDASVTEGNSGTATMTFTVSLDSAAVAPISVDYATTDGTATAPTDYTAAAGTVTFSAGDLTKTVGITVNGDTTVEPDETLYHDLSNAVNASILDGRGVGTIVNDDGADTKVSEVPDKPSATNTGQLEKITIRITNNGPNPTTNVAVTDVLPSTFLMDTHQSSSLCTAPTGTDSLGRGGTTTCTQPSLTVGQSKNIAVWGYATVSGPNTNQITVSSSLGDPYPSNNSASLNIPVGGPTCTILGTMGADTLTGTSGDDSICPFGGDDTVNADGQGSDGNDYIAAGDGNDTVIAGDGNDTLMGDFGNDHLTGGPGSDHMYGLTGSDTFYAQDGQPDFIDGGKGTDDAYVDSSDTYTGIEHVHLQ
jgi:uncharacterized repeat protein (TIGR01451 family)